MLHSQYNHHFSYNKIIMGIFKTDNCTGMEKDIIFPAISLQFFCNSSAKYALPWGCLSFSFMREYRMRSNMVGVCTLSVSTCNAL